MFLDRGGAHVEPVGDRCGGEAVQPSAQEYLAAQRRHAFERARHQRDRAAERHHPIRRRQRTDHRLVQFDMRAAPGDAVMIAQQIARDREAERLHVLDPRARLIGEQPQIGFLHDVVAVCVMSQPPVHERAQRA